MNVLNLRGGGADLACDDCLREAKHERAGQIVGVAQTEVSAGECCGWCGWEPRPVIATCRIFDCSYHAEPGELCWFHKSPPDPDLEREAMDDLERDRLEAC